MDVSATNSVAVRVARIAQDAAMTEGEAAVKLIEDAKPPPMGVNGEGAHVNTYA